MPDDLTLDLVDTSSIMAALKTATSALHHEAEQHPFQRSLVAGCLPLEHYTAYLGQMLWVHTCLEGALSRLCARLSAFREVVSVEQFQEGNLRADLDFFGRSDEGCIPLPAVLRFRRAVCWQEGRRPFALLGGHYVLEGSKNGAKFVARAVRAAYAIAPGSGDRFLDPYGAAQRQKWASFKSSMDALKLNAAQRAHLHEGARGMFQSVIHLADELHRAAREQAA